jgi:hypothetical protein
MSALRHSPAVLLAAVALAACADGGGPAGPASAPADRESRPNAAARDYAIYAFGQIAYDAATATASAMPRDGSACHAFDTGHALYQLVVTPRMLSNLQFAKTFGYETAILFDTEIVYAMGGTKSVNESYTFEMTGRPLLTDYPEPFQHTIPGIQTYAGRYGRALSDDDISALQAGDILTVRVYVSATASVPPEVCGREVYGAHAQWRLRKPPALHMYALPDSTFF